MAHHSNKAAPTATQALAEVTDARLTPDECREAMENLRRFFDLLRGWAGGRKVNADAARVREEQE